MDIKNLNEVAPFITKDGSEIRELLAHRNPSSAIKAWPRRGCPQARARRNIFIRGPRDLLPHARTGRMHIEARRATCGQGCHRHSAGQRHKLWNTGKETLRLLCCCAPAYEHDDTIHHRNIIDLRHRPRLTMPMKISALLFLLMAGILVSGCASTSRSPRSAPKASTTIITRTRRSPARSFPIIPSAASSC